MPMVRKISQKKFIDESTIKRAIQETDCDLKLTSTDPHKEEREKLKRSNTEILKYVAKSLSLLGRKVRQSINKQKQKLDLFTEAVPMPLSMQPKIIIENYELLHHSN
jgi:hypothetical protein